MLKVVSLSSNHDLQNWIMTFWVSSEKWTYKRCEKGFSTSNANIIEKFRLGRDLLQSLNCPPAQSRANLCVAQGFCFLQLFRKSQRMETGPCPRTVPLTAKLFSLCPNWNFPCCSLCPLPLALSLFKSEKSLAVLYIAPLLVVENCNQIPLQPSLLQAAQTPLPQLLLMHHVLLALLVASAGLALSDNKH